MRRIFFVNAVGLLAIVCITMTGCGVWPSMTEDNNRRPLAMGKSDLVLSPWATQPVHLNEHYGNSYRYAKESQILNPQAGNSLVPLEGMGGLPAQHTVNRYHEIFKKGPFEEKKGGSSKIIFSGGK